MSEQVAAAAAAGPPVTVDTTGDAGAVAGPDLSDAALEAAAIAEFSGPLATPDAAAAGAAPDTPKPGEAPIPTPSPDGPGTDPATLEAARIQALVDKQLETHRAREAANRELEGVKAELAALKAAVADRDGKLAKLKEDPLEVLQGEGWDAEALAGAMAGMKNPTTVQMRQLTNTLKAMQARLDEVAAERTRAEQAAAAARTVESFKATEVRPRLEAIISELPHLQAEMEAWNGKSDVGALTDFVYARLNAEFQGGGQVPTAEAMARSLEAQAKKRIEAIRGKLTPTAAGVSAPSPKPPTPKTLTNSLTQSTRAPAEPADLSDAALTQAAIEFARNFQAS